MVKLKIKIAIDFNYQKYNHVYENANKSTRINRIFYGFRKSSLDRFSLQNCIKIIYTIVT